MKKPYEAPVAEIEKFTIDDILTQSTGLGDGDEGTTMPDEF